MTDESTRPALRMLESDEAGHCDPDSGTCAVPAAEISTQETEDASDGVPRAFWRPTPVCS